MLFNSLTFVFFFIVVTTAYFVLPQRARWWWLLAASCYFYMAFIPAYLLILLFTIVVDYFAGIWIERSSGRRRKLFLVASLLANVGCLAFFKYGNFTLDNFAAALRLAGIRASVPHLDFILPIGLSFHTFQAMSYTIEVFRGRQRAERHFGIYALYVMFYPQLVAGPIERPQNLLHQFREHYRFDAERVVRGFQRMLWGGFKKIVVADRLGLLVDAVYDAPRLHDGPTLVAATVFFAFQIYADFSGYSDIAIGAAEVMGFRLMTNFRAPYRSRSVGEFWRRWHISLSTWFRDYVYVPLGGSRTPLARQCFNLLVTFGVSGLWHGANWTYVVWGLLNGGFVIVERLWQERRPARPSQSLAACFLTFAAICVTWIFFRARNLEDAVYVLGHLGAHWPALATVAGRARFLGSFGVPMIGLVVSLAALFLMHGVDLFTGDGDIQRVLSARPGWQRWGVYYGLTAAIFLFGRFGNQQFIYFQF
jgi:D-alanyl-lipoteichoic acid acyltransferase DltB (MBOAT superfamily)